MGQTIQLLEKKNNNKGEEKKKETICLSMKNCCCMMKEEKTRESLTDHFSINIVMSLMNSTKGKER